MTGTIGHLPAFAPAEISVDAAVALRALHDMRRTRRRRRLGDVAWGDLAYRVYTTGLATLVLVVFASGFVGDDRLDVAGTATVRRDGPAWAGVVLAAAVLAGTRSGSRGGPLALDAAEVHHVLSAPVDRGAALRRPVVGLLGYGTFAAVAVGGLGGSLLAQRLPGPGGGWVLSGALFAAMLAAGGLGAALLTASRRVPVAVTVVPAVVLCAWAVLDATGAVPLASPSTAAASVLFWPLRFTWWPLVGIAVAMALAVVGARTIGGLSMEHAVRRTRLVGQMRFAVTQQDLRSVLLLRRQLAAERPRSRPLVRLPRRFGARAPVQARDLHSLLRWPTVRIARVVVLGAVAGLALRGVWSGTTPLVIPAGLAGYLAGLDALEPLAQEVDHPTLLSGYPHPRGAVMVHHLVVPTALLVAVGFVGVAAAWLVDPHAQVLAIGALAAVSGAAAAVAGAAISIVSEVTVDRSGSEMAMAEVAGARVAMRTLWPPLVATLGVAPVLAGQRAARAGAEAIAPACVAAGAVLVGVTIVVVWVRYREEMHRSIDAAMGGEAT